MPIGRSAAPTRRACTIKGDSKYTDEGYGKWSCKCGWVGKAEEIQFARKHKLTLDGVLWSHVKGSGDGLYECKKKGCMKVNMLEEFGDCLFSHNFGPDGVVTVKDAYGDYVVKTPPVTSKREQVRGYIGNLRGRRH